MFASDADGKGKRMNRVDAVRGKNRCFPRPPPSQKGGPNGCWYKAALNRLGYYVPPDGMGITDDLDEPGFRDALYAFQRQATVYFGDTNIGPGTTTERVLMDALERTDESAAYVWRTASDDKVRDEHAMRAGKIYTWDAPPDGDHPGDDYNCRCWAEPLNPAQHPWAVWARGQAENRELLKTPYIQNINAAALVFEGAVISVEVCLRNGRCRTWLMEQAAKATILYSHKAPPNTLPGFPYAKKLDKFKGRRRWVDSKGRIYEWDSQHGEVEVYDKTGKKHLGAFDPNTGEKKKDGAPSRKIKK